MHVTLITLGTRRLEEATAFYEALGWTRSTDSVDGQVSFLVGGAVVLGLFGWEDLAEDATVPTQDVPGFRGSSLAANQPDREAVDAFMARAEQAGATIVKAPHEVFWGGYSGYFTDLDGHLWEVAHNPGWTLTSDGRAVLPVAADDDARPEPTGHVSTVMHDTNDLDGAVAFWTAVLGLAVVYEVPGKYAYLDRLDGEHGPRLAFQQVEEPAVGKNRLHLDMKVPDRKAFEQRVVELGGSVIGEHQEGDFPTWTVLADPEGNLFCAYEATS